MSQLIMNFCPHFRSWLLNVNVVIMRYAFRCVEPSFSVCLEPHLTSFEPLSECANRVENVEKT